MTAVSLTRYVPGLFRFGGVKVEVAEFAPTSAADISRRQ
jgi:hypothetical protein